MDDKEMHLLFMDRMLQAICGTTFDAMIEDAIDNIPLTFEEKLDDIFDGYNKRVNEIVKISHTNCLAGPHYLIGNLYKYLHNLDSTGVCWSWYHKRFNEKGG